MHYRVGTVAAALAHGRVSSAVQCPLREYEPGGAPADATCPWRDPSAGAVGGAAFGATGYHRCSGHPFPGRGCGAGGARRCGNALFAVLPSRESAHASCFAAALESGRRFAGGNVHPGATLVAASQRRICPGNVRDTENSGGGIACINSLTGQDCTPCTMMSVHHLFRFTSGVFQ